MALMDESKSVNQWLSEPTTEASEFVGDGVGVVSPHATPPDAVVEPKSVTIEATIIRADGTRIELGAVNKQFSNPVQQLVWNLVGKRRAARKIREANKSIGR